MVYFFFSPLFFGPQKKNPLVSLKFDETTTSPKLFKKDIMQKPFLTLYTPSFLPKDWHFPAEKTECDSGARPSPCARFPGARLCGADAG